MSRASSILPCRCRVGPHPVSDHPPFLLFNDVRGRYFCCHNGSAARIYPRHSCSNVLFEIYLPLIAVYPVRFRILLLVSFLTNSLHGDVMFPLLPVAGSFLRPSISLASSFPASADRRQERGPSCSLRIVYFFESSWLTPFKR